MRLSVLSQRRHRKWLLAASTLSFLLVARGGIAHAADEPKPEGTPVLKVEGKASGDAKADEKKGPTGEEVEGDVEFDEPDGEPKDDNEAGEKKKHEKHEEFATVGADLVLGWGKVPFVVPNPVGGGAAPQTQTVSRQDQVSSNVQSFIFALSFEVAKHLDVGLRAPLTFATFNPDGAASRNTVAAGNVELEGEYSGAIARGLRLFGSLGVALPTADGNEIPNPLVNAPVGSIDQGSFDHYSLAKAAAFARGYEDNALFEPNRFGLVPKIGLLYRTHGLSIEPYIKVENLIGTSSNLENSYVGEFVGALRVGYWIHKEFEVAVRGWFNTGFAGGDEDKKTSAAVEPQVVLRFGPVRPYAGLILPVAGPPNDNGFIGARIGVSASF
jgi:hypothetical protein